MAETLQALALQDLLRRDACLASKSRECFHRVTLGLGITAAFAETIAGWIVRHFALAAENLPQITASALLAIAVLGLLSELLAGRHRDRAMRLHLLSRDALILALSSYARAIPISATDWKTVRDETIQEVSDARLEKHAATNASQSNTRKFLPQSWWKTKRKAGQGRLAAMLLENSIWSADLFNRAAKAARNRATLRVVILVVSLAAGLLLNDARARSIEASAIIVFLTYILTTDTFDRVSTFQNACTRLKDLRHRLKGVDAHIQKGGDLNALTSIYCTTVATTPPIPTEIYTGLESSLRPTNELLEDELSV